MQRKSLSFKNILCISDSQLFYISFEELFSLLYVECHFITMQEFHGGFETVGVVDLLLIDNYGMIFLQSCYLLLW